MSNPNPTPRTWSETDPYLKAAHLGGKTITATIREIQFVEVHPRPGQVEIKPVMYFAESSKGLILTSTNKQYLRATFGDNIAASHGKRVTLRAVTKRIAGREVDTILIGQPTAQPASPAGN